MIEEWEPDDVTSLVMLVGLIILIAMGYDHNLITTFCAINAGYLGFKQYKKSRKKEGE